MARSRVPDSAALSVPVSERVCDAVCIGFALWTLCCHAAVALGGNLFQLMATYALVCGVTVAATVHRIRCGGAGARQSPPPVAGSTVRRRLLWLLQGVGLALSLVAALRYGNVIALWWYSVLLLGAAAVVFVLLARPTVSPSARGLSLELMLWIVASVCVVLTFVCHRYNVDDVFYVNVAVAAADFPKRAVLSGDTLHGIEGLPLHMPAHRVLSYELWNGALSYLTGIPAIYCFHWISASIAAFLVPLAYAKLARLLTPGWWLWTVAAVLFVLVAAGETPYWYGNFAFVRMWQGKAIYLSVFLPLVYAYALQFALRPTPRGWLLLCAVQIAAVGCSSSAIWGAPAAALMAVCCVLRPTRSGARTLALSALACLYVLGVGWFLKQTLEGLEAFVRPAQESGVRLEEALDLVLGDSDLQTFGILSILIGWACCARGLAQRFAIVVPLAVTAILLNPWADEWARSHVTGPSYWRSLWAVPIPLLMAFVLTSPLHLNGRTGTRALGRTACALLLISFALLIPRFSGLDEENGTHVRWPMLKVDPATWESAAALNKSVAPGSHVVAFSSVSRWVPTFHHHAYPLMVRLHYLEANRDRLEPGELRDRRLMSRFTEGILGAGYGGLFRDGLERYDVEAVCLRRGDRTDEARLILLRSGFRKTTEVSDHEIWVRASN